MNHRLVGCLKITFNFCFAYNDFSGTQKQHAVNTAEIKESNFAAADCLPNRREYEIIFSKLMQQKGKEHRQ